VKCVFIDKLDVLVKLRFRVISSEQLSLHISGFSIVKPGMCACETLENAIVILLYIAVYF
jgi:hypothetical protein